MRLLIVALALTWQVDAFGLQEHAAGLRGAIKRAKALEEECIEKDKARSEVGKALIQASDARPLFRQYLLAVRHLMGVLSFPDYQGAEGLDALLARVGELDMELSQLTALGKAEPYYFWHGPKRHVPSKWEELMGYKVGGTEVRNILTQPASNVVPAPAPAPMKLPHLGLAYPKKPRSAAKLIENAVLRIDHLDADSCAVIAHGHEAGIKHVIVSGPQATDHLLPCLGSSSLRMTWDLSQGFDGIFESGSDTPLQEAVDAALKATKRKTIDVLGLPPKAFMNQRLKGYVAGSVEDFKKAKKVKDIALVGPLPSKSLQKILSGPLKPTIWITPHDDCAHITPRLLELADGASMQVIAHGTPCSTILLTAAAAEDISAMALWARWTAELGMSVALPHTEQDPKTVLRDASEADPISQATWRLLSSTAMLSRPAALAVQPDVEDTFGIRPIIARAMELAKKELADAGRPPVNGTLRSDLWDEIDADKKAFVKNDFIIYKDNFLSPEMYKKVQDEAARLWTSPELEPNCNLNGIDRVGGYVSDASVTDTSLYQAFYGSEEFRQWISRINGQLMFPSDFPLELREYPTGSSGMQCHRDLLMYTNATLDMEFVYTIDNLGTCITTYENREGEVTEVHTQPNSLIMVRPNAAMHCVKPAEGGRRTMLKFIYVGDYRKSSEFGYYAVNECGDDNPNVKVVSERRQKLQTLEL